MELLKNKFEKYQIPTKQSESKLQQFQERALEICQEFSIVGMYRIIIFKHAKNSLPYLEGKVALCYEKWGKEGCKNKGRYLVALFKTISLCQK